MIVEYLLGNTNTNVISVQKLLSSIVNKTDNDVDFIVEIVKRCGYHDLLQSIDVERGIWWLNTKSNKFKAFYHFLRAKDISRISIIIESITSELIDSFSNHLKHALIFKYKLSDLNFELSENPFDLLEVAELMLDIIPAEKEYFANKLPEIIFLEKYIKYLTLQNEASKIENFMQSAEILLSLFSENSTPKK